MTCESGQYAWVFPGGLSEKCKLWFGFQRVACHPQVLALALPHSPLDVFHLSAFARSLFPTLIRKAYRPCSSEIPE